MSLPSALVPASQQCAIARALMLVMRLQSPGHSWGVFSLAMAAVSCSLRRAGLTLFRATAHGALQASHCRSLWF